MNICLETALSVVMLLVGFGLLVKGADWFVDGSSGIAKKLGVSQLVIALTIVAMGTSIPETAVSLQAVLKGSGDLAVGNIVGTNTLNILFILGLTAVITPMIVQRSTFCFEMPMVIGTAIVFGIMGLGRGFELPSTTARDGFITRGEGVILLVLFGLYLVYLGWLAKKTATKNALVPVEKPVPWPKLIFVVVLGLGLVILGSSITVNSAVQIARTVGISERFIGLTVVALGTSLPELATSITAAIKKQDDLAVGNIVGSNIYNMLFIGGITAVIRPIPFGSAFVWDSIICVGASALLWLCVIIDKKRRLTLPAGIVMLLSYVAYLVWLILK